VTQWMRDASAAARWAGGASFVCRPHRDFDREVRELLAAAAQAEDHDEDLRGAYHETAHAYVLWTLGMGFDLVELGQHGSGATTRSAGGPAWDVETAVVTLLAGGAAERQFFGRADEFACSEDESAAAELLHGRPGRYAQYAERAATLVRQGADQIAFGAMELLARGVVPAADMIAVFEEHAGRSLDERLLALDAKYRLEPGTCRLFADGALAELRTELRTARRQAEVRSVVALDERVVLGVSADGSILLPTTSYGDGRRPRKETFVITAAQAREWPQAAVDAYLAMDAAADARDWSEFRRQQDRLIEVQRPLKRANAA